MKKAGVLTAAIAVGLTATLVAAGNPRHENTHARSPWHFAGGTSKLQRYRIIARHDRWVIKTKRVHPQKLVAFHRRELSHALAHIKKLTPQPFQYPWWWWPLGQCESGQSLTYNDGLYEGWINFLNSTWLDYGGGEFAAHAYDASMYEQYVVTLRMHAHVPWSQSNPECSRRIGL